MSHLERLGIPELKVNPDPVRIASEGALWGAIQAHGFLPDTVIVSDDAGQFMVGRHALCWVHAERLVHKLDTFTDQQRTAQRRIRGLIWWFYRDLKAYGREPSPRRRTELRARFDRDLPTPDRLRHARPAAGAAARQQGRAADGAGAARGAAAHQRFGERPPLPGDEAQDQWRYALRCRAATCRDAFLGLMKTCQKLGLSFWDYLGAKRRAPARSPITLDGQERRDRTAPDGPRRPKRRSEIADALVPGLRLVVQPSGAKSWAVRYHRAGKVTKMTLGPMRLP